MTVTVTDVNEGPEITGRPTISVEENRDPAQVLATYSATDPEQTSVEITGWSLSGTDRGDFTISERGQLAFRVTPDHERPADSGRDNEYRVTVRASDGRYYGYFDVTITVKQRKRAAGHHGRQQCQLQGKRHGHGGHLSSHRSGKKPRNLKPVGDRRRLLHHQQHGRTLLWQSSGLRGPKGFGRRQRLSGDGAGQRRPAQHSQTGGDRDSDQPD